MKISNEEKVQNIKHIYAAGDASALITEKGMYVTGNNDYGALFTKDATDRVYLSKVEEEKNNTSRSIYKKLRWTTNRSNNK